MNRRQLSKILLASPLIANPMALLRPTRAEAALHCQDYQTNRLCVAGIPSQMIHVSASQNPQFQSQWCWAACISMIFQYHGHPVSQSRIVREAYGDLVNMPATPWTILKALNRPWVDDQGFPFRVNAAPEKTTVEQMAWDLNDNQPLIVGTQGHAMVLTALQYNAPFVVDPVTGQMALGPVQVVGATVRDPWPGNGKRQLSASEMSNIMFLTRIRVG